jgi:hypothetical protein
LFPGAERTDTASAGTIDRRQCRVAGWTYTGKDR